MQWWIEFNGEDDPETGLSAKEQDAGLGVLVKKGLLRKISDSSYQLDDYGFEACLHPELINELLAPRRPVAPGQQNITINADNMRNTQIGHNNTLNVSYTTALTELREQVEASELSTETKQGWVATIDGMLRHPLMPGIVTLTAAAIAASGH